MPLLLKSSFVGALTKSHNPPVRLAQSTGCSVRISTYPVFLNAFVYISSVVSSSNVKEHNSSIAVRKERGKTPSFSIQAHAVVHRSTSGCAHSTDGHANEMTVYKVEVLGYRAVPVCPQPFVVMCHTPARRTLPADLASNRLS